MRPVRATTALTAAAGLSAAVLLAGCSAGTAAPRGTVTVTVPAPLSGASSLSGSSGPSASSSAGSGSGPATAASSAVPSPAATTIDGTCASDLPELAVLNALDRNRLAGDTAYVVGAPEKSIGRLTYLNCQYGLRGKGTNATPAVEISVNLYDTPERAAARIPGTVEDYTAHGASDTDVTLSGGVHGHLLTGGSGDYGVPLLVAATGRRTLAVSMDSHAVPTPSPQQATTALANLALTRTAGG